MSASKSNSHYLYLSIIAVLILIILHLLISNNQTLNLNYITPNTLKTNISKVILTPKNTSNKLIISPLLKYMNGGFKLGSIPRLIDGFNDKIDSKQDFIIEFSRNETYNHKIIIDIGLFNGHETIGAILKGFTVFGFEANPIRMNKTIINFRNYGLQNNYTLIDCISKTNEKDNKICSGKAKPKFSSNDIKGYGFAYLFLAGVGSAYKPVYIANLADWSNIKDINPYNNKKSDKFKRNKLITQIIRLDYLFDSNIKILLLKTDTQGYEENVFRGAYNLFKNKQIEYIIFELWNGGLKDKKSSPKQLLDYLQNTLDIKICFDATLDKMHSLEHKSDIIGYTEYIEKYGNKYFEDIVCIADY